MLRRAEGRFTKDDRRFIATVAGGHPYLTQVAASELWEAYEEGEKAPRRRWQRVGQALYNEVALTLSDTWRCWPPPTRRVFAAVALAHIGALGQHRFHVERLIHDLPDFGLELRSLKKRGFVTEDAAIPGGWRVRPQAFLWWLADELVRMVRRETPLEEWLAVQEWEGLLTRGEKQQLGKAIHAVADLLKDGAATLIEAAAKGAGKALI